MLPWIVALKTWLEYWQCQSTSFMMTSWHGYAFRFTTLRPTRNEQHFADDIFKRIFFNENVWILIIISLKFVSNGPINIIPALRQIMAWRRPGDKPLYEPMMVNLLTHICVTRPQWVKSPMCGTLMFSLLSVWTSCWASSRSCGDLKPLKRSCDLTNELLVAHDSNIYIVTQHLTLWDRVTHIWVSKLTAIGADNSFSSGLQQAIIENNAGWNIINGTLRNKFWWSFNQNTYIFNQENAFESGKWRPFFLNVLL